MPNQTMPARHLKWLISANSDPRYPASFYKLKATLLERFGTKTGLVLQGIIKTCWGCGGSGCLSCGETGVYRVRCVVLQQWLVGHYTFLTPLYDVPRHIAPSDTTPETIDAWHRYAELICGPGKQYIAYIRGYVKHTGMDPRHDPEQSFWKLLLHYDPVYARLLWESMGLSFLPLHDYIYRHCCHLPEPYKPKKRLHYVDPVPF